jgi:hypothetical protein
MGGVFDLSLVGDSFRSFFTDLLDSANAMMDGLRLHMSARWAARPLHVGFTNSDEVNAFATKGKYAEYIFITIGAVCKVCGTMYGMLSTPVFLPAIGNPGLDEMPNEPLADGFPPLPLLRTDQCEQPVSFYLPLDQTRATFAMHLSSTALQFLLMHEIGHVVAGHLELRERQGCGPTISEFGTAGTQDARTPPRHVLECDADAFAAHTESFLDLHPNTDRLWTEVFRWSAVPGRSAGFIAYATAISILFRMLGRNGYAPGSLNPATHPPPAVRSCLAISRSMSLAVIAGRFAMDEFSHLCGESVFHVEETWASLGLPGQQLGKSHTWADRVGRLSMELEREYERWKADVQEFARLPVRWHASWPGAD